MLICFIVLFIVDFFLCYAVITNNKVLLYSWPLETNLSAFPAYKHIHSPRDNQIRLLSLFSTAVNLFQTENCEEQFSKFNWLFFPLFTILANVRGWSKTSRCKKSMDILARRKWSEVAAFTLACTNIPSGRPCHFQRGCRRGCADGAGCGGVSGGMRVCQKPGWRLCAIDSRFLVSGHATCPSFLQRHFPLLRVCLKNKQNYFPVCLFLFVCCCFVCLFVVVVVCLLLCCCCFVWGGFVFLNYCSLVGGSGSLLWIKPVAAASVCGVLVFLKYIFY